MISRDLFFVALVGVLGLADLWWVVIRTPRSSRGLAGLGWRVSAFPFALGVGLGRLATVGAPPIGGGDLPAAGVLAGIFWVVVVGHWVLRRWLDLPSWFGLIYIPCGVPTGMFFWPV